MGFGKKIILWMTGTVILSLGIGAAYAAIKLNQLDLQELDENKITVNDGLKKDLGEGYTTFVVFGGDSREGGLDTGVRSDCIIVVSLNNKTKELKMASVYRDTLLDIGGGTLQKCNAAYSFGGPEQAISMLNMNLDLNIKDYVTVDFKAVAEAIDLLGGIELEIKEEEIQYINEFLQETADVAGKEAKEITHAGVQKLDGAQATTYARIRSTAGGDFTRTERQRLVIEKMLEKVTKSKLGTINKIVDKVFPDIRSSFSVKDILLYATFFKQYHIGGTEGFPMDKSADTISGKGSVVIPVTLEQNVQQLHEFLYATKSYTPSSKVSSISASIESMVGNRKKQDEKEIYKRTYEDTEEDRKQEYHNDWGGNTYTPPVQNEKPGDNNEGYKPGGNDYNEKNPPAGGNGDNSNGGSNSDQPESDGNGNGGSTNGNENSGDGGGSTNGGGTNNNGTNGSGTDSGGTDNGGMTNPPIEQQEPASPSAPAEPSLPDSPLDTKTSDVG